MRLFFHGLLVCLLMWWGQAWAMQPGTVVNEEDFKKFIIQLKQLKFINSSNKLKYIFSLLSNLKQANNITEQQKNILWRDVFSSLNTEQVKKDYQKFLRSIKVDDQIWDLLIDKQSGKITQDIILRWLKIPSFYVERLIEVGYVIGKPISYGKGTVAEVLKQNKLRLFLLSNPSLQDETKIIDYVTMLKNMTTADPTSNLYSIMNLVGPYLVKRNIDRALVKQLLVDKDFAEDVVERFLSKQVNAKDCPLLNEKFADLMSMAGYLHQEILHLVKTSIIEAKVQDAITQSSILHQLKTKIDFFHQQSDIFYSLRRNQKMLAVLESLSEAFFLILSSSNQVKELYQKYVTENPEAQNAIGEINYIIPKLTDFYKAGEGESLKGNHLLYLLNRLHFDIRDNKRAQKWQYVEFEYSEINSAEKAGFKETDKSLLLDLIQRDISIVDSLILLTGNNESLVRDILTTSVPSSNNQNGAASVLEQRLERHVYGVPDESILKLVADNVATKVQNEQRAFSENSINRIKSTIDSSIKNLNSVNDRLKFYKHVYPLLLFQVAEQKSTRVLEPIYNQLIAKIIAENFYELEWRYGQLLDEDGYYSYIQSQQSEKLKNLQDFFASVFAVRENIEDLSREYYHNGKYKDEFGTLYFGRKIKIREGLNSKWGVTIAGPDDNKLQKQDAFEKVLPQFFNENKLPDLLPPDKLSYARSLLNKQNISSDTVAFDILTYRYFLIHPFLNRENNGQNNGKAEELVAYASWIYTQPLPKGLEEIKKWQTQLMKAIIKLNAHRTVWKDGKKIFASRIEHSQKYFSWNLEPLYQLHVMYTLCSLAIQVHCWNVNDKGAILTQLTNPDRSQLLSLVRTTFFINQKDNEGKAAIQLASEEPIKELLTDNGGLLE